jgi:hypothetical protein
MFPPVVTLDQEDAYPTFAGKNCLEPIELSRIK